VFLVNSHNSRFSATYRRSPGKPDHASRHTFSRSYGVNLPSSLTRVLSRALEYSSRPPESVCSTVIKEALYAAFLGSLELSSCRAEAQPHHLSATRSSVCPCWVLELQPTGLNGDPCPPLDLSYSVPAYFNATLDGTGILTCCPSSTPFGLDLGTGSPMGGLSFPRKPWTYGDRVSRSVYRYSCLHKLFSDPVPVLTVWRVSI
jgi:hypothetical protein